jgi:hypothetical protein
MHTSARQLADPRIILTKVARDLPEGFWWSTYCVVAVEVSDDLSRCSGIVAVKFD